MLIEFGKLGLIENYENLGVIKDEMGD